MPRKLINSRMVACDHIQAAMSSLLYAKKLAWSDHSKHANEYKPWLTAALDAAEKAINGLQIAIIEDQEASPNNAPKNHKKEGFHDLICQVCEREFRARNPKRKVCYHGCRVADIPA